MKLVLKRILFSFIILGFVPVVPIAADDHMDGWMKEVRKEFASKQRYPREAIEAGAEGTVTVAVRVSASGSIVGFDIRESSKHRILDEQVLSLLSRVDPLPALPEGATTHDFVIPLSYRMSAGAAVDAEVNVADSMKKWGKSVMHRVARKQAFPTHLLDMGIEGVTKIKLKIAANGSITSQEIVSSSGHAELDQETLDLVGRINPLPALPAGKEEFTVTIPVNYRVGK